MQRGKLIPRRVIWGEDRVSGPRLSPDGDQVLYQAHDGQRDNLWLADVARPEDASVLMQDHPASMSGWRWLP